jgi:hypothetical protein
MFKHACKIMVLIRIRASFGETIPMEKKSHMKEK